MIDTLFVRLGFFVTLEKCFLIWRRHHFNWSVTNFNLYSVLMAIKQWGFFIVPHILWHGSTISSGHLRGPLTLTFVADRLSVELSLAIKTYVCRNLTHMKHLLESIDIQCKIIYTYKLTNCTNKLRNACTGVNNYMFNTILDKRWNK